jgi:hypothetical protein
MRWRMSALCLCAFLAAAPSRAADPEKPENPFKNVKVGDWSSYKMITEAAGQKFDGTVKITVKAKDDKEATIVTVATVNGMELPGQEAKIDLTKPFDPTNVTAAPKDAAAKVKTLDEGKETITIGKTKYECKWTSYKVTAKAQNMDIESEVKFWMAKDAPLSGMVQMESKTSVAGMNVVAKMTLDDSGKGK